jgi:hypothetical protein
MDSVELPFVSDPDSDSDSVAEPDSDVDSETAAPLGRADEEEEFDGCCP